MSGRAPEARRDEIARIASKVSTAFLERCSTASTYQGSGAGGVAVPVLKAATENKFAFLLCRGATSPPC